jgi:tetraacyldisaccharide-1-P 4'-kinase
LGAEIAGKHAFKDHIRYRQTDVAGLLRAKQSTGADFFITTEKDLINLGPLASQLQPLQTVELRVELEAPEQALDVILEIIEQRSHCKV